jgi:hypothetical protein
MAPPPKELIGKPKILKFLSQLAKDKIIADGKGIFGSSGKSTKSVTVSEARVPLWRLP